MGSRQGSIWHLTVPIGNYFKAVKAQIPKEDNPRGFLERNEPGANHFVSEDEGLMNLWNDCGTAASEAEAAQDSLV